MNEFEGVIIDAGHGGIDSGAIGNNLQEKDLTLEAAKYINNRLNELGIPNKMTREEDIYLPKNERIKKVLELYNNSPNTILISNHINAGGAEGAEVVYSLKNNSTFANLILDNIEKQGQIKRKVYQRRLPENPNKDYYYILRESGNTEPILIEYGFIDNVKDANKLQNNITKYAEAVVKSIAEYLNYPYIPPEINYYIVEKGDTLYSLSKKFNVSIEDLKRINNLTTNQLQIGQKLFLTKQSPEEDTTIYIVERGDTLYSIALKNNTTVDILRRLNKLTDNTLSIGQNLKIPTQKSPEEISLGTYTVKKGDSLWKISQKYNITVPELIELNNLENLVLQINQKLVVPNNQREDNTYIVEKGDTLWSIANQNNIEVSQLKELNNLESNLLSIGQILKIKN